MLVAIRDFIQNQKMVTLSQLQREFNMHSEVLEPILALLMQRQEIRQLDVEYCKKQCQDCETPQYLSLAWPKIFCEF
jgi:hypothetical protein